MRRPVLVLAALAGFAVAVVPALGKDESITTSPANQFTPSAVTIRPGESVTVSQSSSFAPHNVHWEDRAGPEQAVTTGAFTTSRTFTAPGTYRFYCDQHGGPGGAGMSAVVTVSADDATTTTGTTTTGTTTTDTTPTTTTPTVTTTSTAPAAADATAPRLQAGALRSRGALRVRLVASERARVTATIRRGALRRTVRFTLAKGTTRRVLLRAARPGRYRVTLRATDAAGNRSRTLALVVRVR